MKRKNDGLTWMDHDFYPVDEDLAEGLSGEEDVRRVDVGGVAQNPEIPTSQAFRPTTIGKFPYKVPCILHASDKDG